MHAGGSSVRFAIRLFLREVLGSASRHPLRPPAVSRAHLGVLRIFLCGLRGSVWCPRLSTPELDLSRSG